MATISGIGKLHESPNATAAACKRLQHGKVVRRAGPVEGLMPVIGCNACLTYTLHNAICILGCQTGPDAVPLVCPPIRQQHPACVSVYHAWPNIMCAQPWTKTYHIDLTGLSLSGVCQRCAQKDMCVHATQLPLEALTQRHMKPYKDSIGSFPDTQVQALQATVNCLYLSLESVITRTAANSQNQSAHGCSKAAVACKMPLLRQSPALVVGFISAANPSGLATLGFEASQYLQWIVKH